jgi:SOS-response transcriptional repressor LexA
MSDVHPIQIRILNLRNVRALTALSYREIGRQISPDEGHRIHPQVVKYHMECLIKNGSLTDSDRPSTVSPRQIAQQPADKPQLVRIPIMGAANAGPASILAGDTPLAYMKLSCQLLKSRNYQDLIALRVSGNSMNRAQLNGVSIENNDFIVIDRAKRTPRDREIVVVNDGDMVNVKRIVFDYEHGQVALLSESSEHHDPIYLCAEDNLNAFVEGTVVQVIKFQS